MTGTALVISTQNDLKTLRSLPSDPRHACTVHEMIFSCMVIFHIFNS